ncbi:helix-turn-helix domain-containing protein [Paenibacillus sp. NFR01]|uniref:helix-turn-helix transcriptional regulator n=1 Tax=Paenibacillus sp. NFR01 TaxID=1566279 RepID=UPI0008B0D687|nr:helix-turn-helix domain-containing protein [Paenibacillus sp. NFR01]SES97257.1 two-component system, response regulator YesN [Paenibacillus sp. NFR01]
MNEMTEKDIPQLLRQLREQFLLQLISEEWPGTEVAKERLRALRLEPLAAEGVKPVCATAELQLPPAVAAGASERREMIARVFHSLAREIAARHAGIYPFRDPNGSERLHLAARSGSGGAAGAAALRLYLAELTRAVEETLRLRLRTGIGTETKGVKRLRNSYAAALLALHGGTGAAQNESGDTLPAFSRETQQSLARRIETGEAEAFMQELETRLGIAGEAGQPPGAAAYILLRALLLLHASACKYGLCGGGLQRRLWDAQREVAAGTPYAAARLLVADWVGCLAREIAAIRRGGDRRLAEAVRAYAQRHFASDPALSSLAWSFAMAEDDLHKLFKQDIGLPFQGYVTKQRMALAEQLLEEDSFKLNEIAALTGYKNSDELTAAFKKFSGISPKDYRERHSRKQARLQAELSI